MRVGYSPNKKLHINFSFCALRAPLCTACVLQSLLWLSLQTLTPVTTPSSAKTVSMELYQRHELPKVGPHCCRSTMSRAPSPSCVGRTCRGILVCVQWRSRKTVSVVGSECDESKDKTLLNYGQRRLTLSFDCGVDIFSGLRGSPGTV